MLLWHLHLFLPLNWIAIFPTVDENFEISSLSKGGTSDSHRLKRRGQNLKKLKTTFVRRVSEFLKNYLASLMDFTISDKSYFSQRGQLKRPDHADLRYKCRTYARLLQHLKSLDKNCLGPLRKAYCTSLNLLLRHESYYLY
ncbi:Exocyst complex component SEC3A [Camellia lanceoleosa]|uniref:Exocyst complex component SEC3A n=1 Tax=Camellia lanceoleosa TaxID=1840588 RepID=A0ACC0HDV3_9ERIC|nr:Exocyst complex component SEC3A [Camellia lanceoleosa]